MHWKIHLRKQPDLFKMSRPIFATVIIDINSATFFILRMPLLHPLDKQTMLFLFVLMTDFLLQKYHKQIGKKNAMLISMWVYLNT